MVGCTNSLEQRMQEQSYVFSGAPQSIITTDTENEYTLNLDTLMKKEITNKEDRNKIQAEVIFLSKLKCNNFMSLVNKTRVTNNIFFGNTSTGFATAAAVISGSTSQGLAGVSAISNSLKSSLNEELFSSILTPHIIKEIKNNRDLAYTNISNNQTKELKDYPYYSALADAINYHELCSIPIALSSLLNRVDKQSYTQINYEKLIENIDQEIQKKKDLLSDKSLSLSNSQREEINKQILKLSDKREILIESFSITQPTSKPAPTEAAEKK